MGVSYTIQSPWTHMRIDKATGDVTAADVSMDGSTAGYTFHYTDVPAMRLYSLGPEHERVSIVLEHADASDGKNYEFKIWGYAKGSSPAQLIADVSATSGTARIDDVTTSLYTDTLRVDIAGWDMTVKVADSAANRVASLTFDTNGLSGLYFQLMDITAGMSVRPMIRGC